VTERPDDIDDRAWNEAFDWLVAIDRGSDDPAVAAAFQSWLAPSRTHAVAYAQVRMVWATAPHLEPALASRRHHRQAPEARPLAAMPRIGRRQWLVGAGALAASVALFAATDGWTDLWADYVTATGETSKVTLTDGTRLQLDTDTALRVSYGPGARDVTLLRGRAFFDVAHDTTRPFAVTAGAARASVLGTRFDMRLDGSIVSVAVEEGRVAVSLNGRNVLQRDALASGESLRLDPTTGLARQAVVAPAAIAAWREGRLIVEGWSVAQVLEELGRYHRGVILLRDQELGARLVSGFYDPTRPVEAVRAVAQAHGGRLREIGPWLLIVSRG
jgi:transmembrane sensor